MWDRMSFALLGLLARHRVLLVMFAVIVIVIPLLIITLLNIPPMVPL